MILDDFIDKVLARYVCNVNKDEKKEEYASSLISLCGKVDFQKLLDEVAKYNDSDFTPSVNKILDWSKHCYSKEFKKQIKDGWLHVKLVTPRGNIRNVDCFRAGTSLETIRATYKRMFNSDNFEILEVN